jgi:hypothetical protein
VAVDDFLRFASTVGLTTVLATLGAAFINRCCRVARSGLRHRSWSMTSLSRAAAAPLRLYVAMLCENTGSSALRVVHSATAM